MSHKTPQKNGNGPVPGDGESSPAWAASNALKNLRAAFGQPRKSLNHRYVYAVISQRANGLSIGINLNPDKRCNFDCVYCEINRDSPGADPKVDPAALGAELERVLGQVYSNKFRDLPGFGGLPPELLELKEVALSGDGEPTLCPNFDEAVQEVVRVRSNSGFPFFKIVLITNTTGLASPTVEQGIKLLGKRDEIWAKLEAGTQEHLERINRTTIPLWQVLANILALARRRPVIIQSLFPQVDGQGPTVAEIEQYVQRLKELKTAGAQIELVQVYSAHRPPHRPNCEHLPLKSLSEIAKRVREVTGLKAEVF